MNAHVSFLLLVVVIDGIHSDKIKRLHMGSLQVTIRREKL